MAIVAQGTFADRPLGRTIVTIASRRFTGDFACEAAGKRHVLTWQEGTVVAASSPTAGDVAARIAMTAGLATPTQVGEIVRRQAADPTRDEIEVIAEVARLGADAIAKLRRRILAQRAIRLFALEDASFTLEDTPSQPAMADAALDARWLVYQGVRTHFAADRMDRELGALGSLFRLREEAVASLIAYGFGDDERAVLARLRGGTASLAALEQGMPSTDRLMVRAMLYALISTGAVEVSGPPMPVSRVFPTPAHGFEPTPAPGLGRRPTTTSPPLTRPTTIPPATDGSGLRPRAQRPSSMPPPGPSPRTATMPPPVATDPPVAPRPQRTSSVPPPGGVTTPPGSPPIRLQPRSTAPPVATPPLTPAAAAARARQRSSAPPPVNPNAAPTAPTAPQPGRNRPLDADAIHALIRERIQLVDEDVDYFTLLGVTPETRIEQVRATYFDLARMLHPDRLTAAGVTDESREAQRLFSQINHAFAVLSQPRKRNEYLAVLRGGGQAAARAEQDRAEILAGRLFAAEEHFRRGEMALRRDQLDLATAEFKQAVELNPDDGDHHALLAWATWCSAADKSKASAPTRRALQKAMQLAPRSATPHLFLGRVARNEHKDDEAIGHFHRALELAPEHAEATSELRVLENRKKPGDGKDKDKGGGLFSRFKR